MKKSKLKNVKEFTFDDILLIPQYSKICLEDDYKKIDISTKLTKNINLKIPLVSSPMASVTEWEMAVLMAKMGGIGIIHSFMSKEQQLYQVRKIKQISSDLLVGVAIHDGWNDLLIHVENLTKEKVDVIVLDTYHAYNKRTLEVVKKLKKKFKKIQLIVGNVVTKEATEILCKLGVDGIKVGIGSGSHCTTRLVTGCGRPQGTVIYECSNVAKKFKVPIISDGGIRYSGDIVKAIFLGADTIMIGGLFAGCDQSPGKIFCFGGKKYKKSFGNCSKEIFLQEKNKGLSWKENIKKIVKNILDMKINKKEIEDFNFTEEGLSGLVEYKGNCIEIIKDLIKGLKRGMWYLGASNIRELHKKDELCFISFSSLEENFTRNLITNI